MIFSVDQLKIKYNKYKNVNDKISRLLKNKQLFSVIKGLYTDDENENKDAIASYICTPSYLSFEYILSKYQLIPELANIHMSATCGKKKKKIYETEFGTYIYYDVPKEVFKYGVNLVETKDYKYFVATKEKALCDKLYNTSPLHSIKNLKEYLFENLRIDEEEFEKLNKEDLKFLTERYKSTNCKLLLDLINK